MNKKIREIQNRRRLEVRSTAELLMAHPSRWMISEVRAQQPEPEAAPQKKRTPVFASFAVLLSRIGLAKSSP